MVILDLMLAKQKRARRLGINDDLNQSATPLIVVGETIVHIDRHVDEDDRLFRMIERAKSLQASGLHEEALAVHDDVVSLVWKHGISEAIAQSLMRRGDCLLALSRPVGALGDYNAALQLMIDEVSPDRVANCLQSRARCFARMNKWDAAMNDFERAARLTSDPAVDDTTGTNDARTE